MTENHDPGVTLTHRDDVIHALDAALAHGEKKGYDRGWSEGRSKLRDEVTKLAQDAKQALIDQGRAQGRAEIEPLIAAAREEGRIQGVQDGRAQAEVAADRAHTDAAFKAGKQEGDREGFKRGRGEGYKAGWNDAITTSPKDHKPK